MKKTNLVAKIGFFVFLVILLSNADIVFLVGVKPNRPLILPLRTNVLLAGGVDCIICTIRAIDV